MNKNWDCSYKKGGSITSVLPPVPEPTKIGIFGGSFNPPHLGHAISILALIMTQDLDEIWVLPTADHPEKEGLKPFDERMKMCIKTFSHIKNVSILPVEELLPVPSYTNNTLRSIKALRPKADLHFIIGTDLVEEIPSWENAKGITDYARFLIVPRQGYPLVDVPEELGDSLVANLAIDLPELSSTFINQLLTRDADVEGFVEKKVQNSLKTTDPDPDHQ